MTELKLNYFASHLGLGRKFKVTGVNVPEGMQHQFAKMGDEVEMSATLYAGLEGNIFDGVVLLKSLDSVTDEEAKQVFGIANGVGNLDDIEWDFRKVNGLVLITDIDRRQTLAIKKDVGIWAIETGSLKHERVALAHKYLERCGYCLPILDENNQMVNPADLGFAEIIETK